ncbi:LysR family transcriptional regulator [Pantoea sp. MBD-2R]|uniref:LysR family transcriptional regulator n=1 Tax=Pantoea sp. MBD-2R TaxID=3141540 RepID=UPI00318301BC
MLDLNLLRLMLILAKEKNVTRAAHKANITQSAFSHALNRLRAQLNDEVFIRTRNGMEPTPYAASIIPVISNTLDRLDAATRGAHPFNPALDAHTFYLGAVDYFEFMFMPVLTARFKTTAPNVRLSVDILSETIKLERMERGQLDAFIGVDTLQHIPHYFHKHPLITDRFVAIAAKTRSDLPAQLNISHLVTEAQIHLPAVSSGADHIDRWLAEQHLYRPLATVVQSYAVGGRIAVASGYLMCVPFRIARELAGMLPLKIVELPQGLPAYELVLLTHSLFDHQPALRWLMGELTKVNIDMARYGPLSAESTGH